MGIVIIQLLLLIAMALVCMYRRIQADIIAVERCWHKTLGQLSPISPDNHSVAADGSNQFDFLRAHQLMLDRDIIDQINHRDNIDGIDALQHLNRWKAAVQCYLGDYRRYINGGSNDDDSSINGENKTLH